MKLKEVPDEQLTNSKRNFLYVSEIGQMKKYLVASWMSLAICMLGTPAFATLVQPTDSGFWWSSYVVTGGDNDGILVLGTDEQQEDDILLVIRWFVNWVLGILWLVALLMLLFWWFRMVTAAGNEEQYNGGFTYVKNAATWLVIIWVIRFILSLVFFVMNLVATEAVGTDWWTAN